MLAERTSRQHCEAYPENRSSQKKMEREEDQSSSITTATTSSYGPVRRPRRNPAVLIRWIEDHPYNPYPTKAEKHYLAYYAGMTQRQLNDWFANARRNIKKVGYDAWKKKHSGFSAILSGFPTLNGSPAGFSLSFSHLANGNSVAAAGAVPQGPGVTNGQSGATAAAIDSGFTASNGAGLTSPPGRPTQNGARYSCHPRSELSNSENLAVTTTRVHTALSPVEAVSVHSYRPSANGLSMNGFGGTQAAIFSPQASNMPPTSVGLSLGAVAGYSGPFNMYKSTIAACNGVSSTTTPDPSEHCACVQCSLTASAVHNSQAHISQAASGHGDETNTTSAGASMIGPAALATASQWSSVPIAVGHQSMGYGWAPPHPLPPSGVPLSGASEAPGGQLATSVVPAVRSGPDVLVATSAAVKVCSSPEGNCNYYKGSPTNVHL